MKTKLGFKVTEITSEGWKLAAPWRKVAVNKGSSISGLNETRAPFKGPLGLHFYTTRGTSLVYYAWGEQSSN